MKREAKMLLNDAKKLDKNRILGDRIKQHKGQIDRLRSKNQMRMAQMISGKAQGNQSREV